AVAIRLVPVVALLVRVDDAVPAARLGAVGPAVVGEDVGVVVPVVAFLVAVDVAVAAGRRSQAAAVLIQRYSEPAEELRGARDRRPDGRVDLAGECDALAARGIGRARGPQVRAERGIALEGKPVVAEEGLGRYGGPSGQRAARPHLLDVALGPADPGERGAAACGGGAEARVAGTGRRAGERSGAAEREVEAVGHGEVSPYQELPGRSADVCLAGEEAPGLGRHPARRWIN